jgi:flavin-dependent dehydrogenase
MERRSLDELPLIPSADWKTLPDQFDATIIGAGPAGALAAYLLARSGVSTLLLEKANFPRHKVCGCCLSAQALQILRRVGLANLVDQWGAVPLNELSVFTDRKVTRFPLTNSRALSRQAFDTSLVQQATAAGAVFVSGVSGHILRNDGERSNSDSVQIGLSLNSIDPEQLLPVTAKTFNSKIALVADGLGGTSASSIPQLIPIAAPNARIGTGAVSLEAPQFYQSQTIYMAYGNCGYMGLVRLEDGRTDMAAAFDAQYLRTCGGIAEAATLLLNKCNMPIPTDLMSLAWKGTVSLTRRRQKLAAHRIFVIGDAAAYVEPFTGEGIAWALASAEAVTPLAMRALTGWQDTLIDEWEREHRIVVGRKQRPTRVVANLLRHEKLANALGRLIDMAPSLSSVLVNLVSAQSPNEERT